MSILIRTSGRIVLDGRLVGLGVKQDAQGTRVYTCKGVDREYAEHTMPSLRYSFSTDAPDSGVAGRAAFETDIRALLARLEA